MLKKLTNYLNENPGQTARDLAEALGTTRREVNQVLHSRTDLFAQRANDFTWKLRDSEPESRHVSYDRPAGPFGPAVNLIPPSQKLCTIQVNETCQNAVRMMLDLDYSAIPVTGNDGFVIGVATLEATLCSMLSLGGNPTVSQFLQNHVGSILEYARYIPAEAHIDVRVDWHDVQHVIIGTPGNPIGILTVADVWKRLHDFCTPFVLIHEIETGLRQLIRRVGLSDQTTIDRLITSMHVPPGQVRPNSLEEFKFSQYSILMSSTHATPLFSDVLGDLGMFRNRLNVIRKLRNDVMHFRDEAITPSNLELLRTFRRQIRAALGS